MEGNSLYEAMQCLVFVFFFRIVTPIQVILETIKVIMAANTYQGSERSHCLSEVTSRLPESRFSETLILSYSSVNQSHGSS